MKSYIIHLIRHGMTDANKKGSYAGITDYPVNEEGIAGLLELNKKYSYPYADVFYSSPLCRCTQTLDIIYDKPEIITIDGLRELNFGDWEDKTAAELKDDSAFSEWMASGGLTATPNGESAEQFGKRVTTAFSEIVESMMRSKTFEAVIAAHGGTIMTILSAFGLPKANQLDWMCANGCGYSLRINMNMWLNSQVFEVYGKVPKGSDQKADLDMFFSSST